MIRGSAVNQDGRSTLLAAPNGLAQVALIRRITSSRADRAGSIAFFETHGTGTALGDPIEVEAIAATVGRSDVGNGLLVKGVEGQFRSPRGRRRRRRLHQDDLGAEARCRAAAAVFRQAQSAHLVGGYAACDSDGVDAVAGNRSPALRGREFVRRRRHDANLIVEEPPKTPAARGASATDARRVLPLSAQSPAALAALVASWAHFLTETPASIDDLCHTAGHRRTHYDHRIAVTGASKDELRSRLEALSAGNSPPGHEAGARAPRLSFVFCGQGPQWFAMGRELLEASPRFRDAVAACDASLRPLAGWSLLETFGVPEERTRLAETEIAQPALFAIQVGLAALWKSWGISPDCVVGHSLGEIAALHVAGALDLDEAVRYVFHRGRIMQQATGGSDGRGWPQRRGSGRRRRVLWSAFGVGAINGPRGVVLSGEAAALDEVLAGLQRRDVSCRMLPVNYAFHSAQMAPLQDALVTRLGDVRLGALDPVYLDRDRNEGNRSPRRDIFRAKRSGAGALRRGRRRDASKLLTRDRNGPPSSSGASIADCAPPRQPAPSIMASLRRGHPRETMLQACAGVYAAGRDMNWKEIQAGPGQIVDLP